MPLTAIDMSPSGDGWAIGSPYGDRNGATIVLHYAGGQWVLEQTPIRGAINSIKTFSPIDAWAAGDQIYHYDGHAWREVQLPGKSDSSQYGTIAAVSPSAIWIAMIGSPTPIIRHYDGRVWTWQPLPTLGGGSYTLTSISMISAEEGWAVVSIDQILEQLSGSLSRQGVASVGEPGERILVSDRLNRHPHGLPECLLGAGAEPAQDGLDLGERLLDRREVGRVGRQEEELAVASFHGLANAGGLVDTQIIQHHDLSRPQRRRQLLRDVPHERRRIHRPLDHPGHVHAVGGERRHQRGVLAVVAWHRAGGSLVMRCPAVEPGQGDIRAAFVDKDELLRVELGDRFAPGFARLLVAFAGCQPFFLWVQPRRRMARHIVASLSCWPSCSAHQAQCSNTVASGAASSRARNAASCSGPMRARVAGNGLALQGARLALLAPRRV